MLSKLYDRRIPQKAEDEAGYSDWRRMEIKPGPEQEPESPSEASKSKSKCKSNHYKNLQR